MSIGDTFARVATSIAQVGLRAFVYYLACTRSGPARTANCLVPYNPPDGRTRLQSLPFPSRLKAFINATHNNALGNVQAIEDDFSEDGNAPLHCLSICWTEFALYVIRFMEDGWE